MRRPTPVHLTDKDRSTLFEIQRGANQPFPRRIALRASIIMSAAEGLNNCEIAQSLRISPVSVARWRQRFLLEGCEGVLKDRPGRGRKPNQETKLSDRVIELTLNEKPDEGDRWTRRLMARKMNVRRSTIGRVWTRNYLFPDVCPSPLLSVPFVLPAKIASVAGLYLNGPERIVAFATPAPERLSRLPNRYRLAGSCNQGSIFGFDKLTDQISESIREVCSAKSFGSLRDRRNRFFRFLYRLNRITTPNSEVHVLLVANRSQRGLRFKTWRANHRRFQFRFELSADRWLEQSLELLSKLNERPFRTELNENISRLANDLQEHKRWAGNERAFVWIGQCEGLGRPR
jgi:transposase